MGTAWVARVFAFSVLSALLAYGFTKDIVKVGIVGPWIGGQIDVTDASTLEVFRAMSYESAMMSTPTGLDDSYLILYVGVGDQREVVATNVFHYYPSALDRPAYFYYADVRGGSSTAEGMWFELRADSEAVLRELLADLGAAVPDSVASGAD